MRKYFLVILLGMAVTLTGCSKMPVPDADSSTWASQNDLSSNTTLEMCSKEIKDYLSKADKEGTGTKKVEKWHQVTVHYIGRLNDTEVFDTSVEEVAKACGKHSPARNYNEGLAFTVGAGQMIAGFDKWVEGMKIGQTKTVTIPAKQAYGEWSEKNIIEVERSQLPAGEYEKGMKLTSANGQTFTVYEVKKDVVSLDANHELAGKDLIFDITLVEIK